MAGSATPLAYVVSVTNNDNPACNGSEFKIAPTLTNELFSHSPRELRLFVPAGGTASRFVVVQSDLFSFDPVFTERVTHACATCLFGAGEGKFITISSPVDSFFCCDEALPTTRGGDPTFDGASGTGCGRPITNGNHTCSDAMKLHCPGGYNRDGDTITCN